MTQCERHVSLFTRFIITRRRLRVVLTVITMAVFGRRLSKPIIIHHGADFGTVSALGEKRRSR